MVTVVFHIDHDGAVNVQRSTFNFWKISSTCSELRAETRGTTVYGMPILYAFMPGCFVHKDTFSKVYGANGNDTQDHPQIVMGPIS